MCKYCRRLKELRNDDLVIYERDINHLNSVIKRWKRHVSDLECLLKWFVMEVENPSDDVLRSVLVKKANALLSVDYIGK